MSTRPGSKIVGVGSALPDNVVTNADFEKRLDTSDTWSTERTGIRERRMGGTTSELAIEAGIGAIKAAGLSPSDIDFLILSTTTPDQTVPATSAVVSDRIGIAGGAMDINAACAGFVYAMVVANSLMVTGQRRVLVIGSDTLSKITDQNDRSTAILFADGAGAVVMEATPDSSLLGWDLGIDGSAQPILYCDYGGYMQMEGREVYKRAVRAMVDSAKKAMEMANVTPEDISLVVPHQANIRIIEAANQRLGIDMAKAAIVLDTTGNTSSGSVPLALHEAVKRGMVESGQLVLFSGFGAGMTWASAVVRWEADSRV